MAIGFSGRVMGTPGNALFLVHRADDGTITHAWAGIVGQNGIDPNVWYSFNADGQPFKVNGLEGMTRRPPLDRLEGES